GLRDPFTLGRRLEQTRGPAAACRQKKAPPLISSRESAISRSLDLERSTERVDWTTRLDTKETIDASNLTTRIPRLRGQRRRGLGAICGRCAGPDRVQPTIGR